MQGWEKNEGLPVHRHQHGKQGSVFAFRAELEAWRESRASAPLAAAPLVEGPAADKPRKALDAAHDAAITSKLRLWLTAGCVALLAGLSLYLVPKQRVRSSAQDVPSSIVVLPFVDMSSGKDQEYFSDGLTEEIIDSLSRVPELRVVARTSAFAYKGKNADIRKIARQLDVDSVLEGSVRKSGDQLRITAQLNRASDGFHYWSQTYDRSWQDIFAVQREISQAIASKLQTGSSHIVVPTQRPPTADLEAYRLYSEARFFFNQFTPNSFRKPIDRYQQAIARDPGFALAYSGLADSYAYMAEFSISPPNEVRPKARDAAEKAVALDRGLGEAHTSVGLVKLDYEWDRPAAEKEFLRAAELNPSSSWPHHWLGHLREAQGRLDEAIAEMRKAMTYDPLSPPLYWDLASDLVLARRYDDTAVTVDKGLELCPLEQDLLLGAKMRLAFRQGNQAAAYGAVATLKKNPEANAGNVTVLALRGIYAAKSGDKAGARRILNALEQHRQKAYTDAVPAVEICSALGDPRCVQLWLQRAYQDHSTVFVYLPLSLADELAKFPWTRELLVHIR